MMSYFGRFGIKISLDMYSRIEATNNVFGALRKCYFALKCVSYSAKKVVIPNTFDIAVRFGIMVPHREANAKTIPFTLTVRANYVPNEPETRAPLSIENLNHTLKVSF